jgi:hypothetical protein
MGAEEPFSAGKESSVVCQSAGSKPSPSITWYKDGAQFTTETFETVSGFLLYRIACLVRNPPDEFCICKILVNTKANQLLELQH